MSYASAESGAKSAALLWAMRRWAWLSGPSLMSEGVFYRSAGVGRSAALCSQVEPVVPSSLNGKEPDVLAYAAPDGEPWARRVRAMKPRRSDRVSLSVPILVSWTSISGRSFTQEARTIAVSKYGATIIMRQMLPAMQQITLRCVGTDKEASALIVGKIGEQPEGYVYGVAVQDPDVNLWDIEFLSLTESEKAVSRLLLECATCSSRKVVHLDELQVEVYEANHGLSLQCEQCAGWTVWKLAVHGGPAGHKLHGAQPQRKPARPPGPAPRTRNERKDIRVPLKMTACIRQLGLAEEVVAVDNISRGGIRFHSPKTYFVGSSVEVAVPYTPGGANIFVLGRIVRVRELPRKRMKEYGVAYIPPDEAPPRS